VVWAFWKLEIYSALVWICIALVSIEVLDRSYEDPKAVSKSIRQVILPAVYLFVGLVLVFTYNDVIVAARNPAAYDWFFLKADSYLLHGNSVSVIAHRVFSRFSPHLLASIDNLYYTMFEQVGAGILIVSMCQGMNRGLRLVGTLLTAYYLALLIFCLWPSMGPFFTCAGHFSHFPHWLKTYTNQQSIISKASVLSGVGRNRSQIGTDYFIAFPSLHVADPIIVFWFLRKWRRIAYVLIVHDILLVPCILLLEWHYVVDLIGGAIVAGIAIWLNNPREDEAVSQESSQNSQAIKLGPEPVAALT
jgi:hypothetical protein